MVSSLRTCARRDSCLLWLEVPTHSPAPSLSTCSKQHFPHQLSSSLTDTDTVLYHLSQHHLPSPPQPKAFLITWYQPDTLLPNLWQPPPPWTAWVWQQTPFLPTGQKPALALHTCDSQPLPSPSLTNIFSHHLCVAANTCPHPMLIPETSPVIFP